MGPSWDLVLILLSGDLCQPPHSLPSSTNRTQMLRKLNGELSSFHHSLFVYNLDLLVEISISSWSVRRAGERMTVIRAGLSLTNGPLWETVYPDESWQVIVFVSQAWEGQGNVMVFPVIEIKTHLVVYQATHLAVNWDLPHTSDLMAYWSIRAWLSSGWLQPGNVWLAGQHLDTLKLNTSH